MGAVEAVVLLIHMFNVSSQFQAFLFSLKDLFQAFISLMNKPDSFPFLLPQIIFDFNYCKIFLILIIVSIWEIRHSHDSKFKRCIGYREESFPLLSPVSQTTST